MRRSIQISREALPPGVQRRGKPYEDHLRQWRHSAAVRIEPVTLSYTANRLGLDPHHRGRGLGLHEGLFDVQTGEFVRQTTHQGWRPHLSWARGQAWALPRFTTVYRFTGDARSPDTARRCADFHIDRTPAHGLPPTDWEKPAPRCPYESSAAAIAAAGLLELAEAVAEPSMAARYRERAFVLLQTLPGPDSLTDQTPRWERNVKHAPYHERKGLGVDESVMRGEYFFLVALDKTFLHERMLRHPSDPHPQPVPT